MTTTDEAKNRLAAAALESYQARKARNAFTTTPLGRWTVRLVTLAAILIAWQLGAQNVNRALIAPPTEIFAALVNQVFITGTIWGPLLVSFTTLFAGLAAALVVGLPVGVAMGRWKRVSWALDPYVVFLYALPHVALVPVMIITLGFDFPFRFFYVAFASVWPIILNTTAGVRAVDPDLIDAAKAYCTRERSIIRKVILPAAAPYMVAGFRQAFSAAWAACVVSEILSTLVGVGGQIELFSLKYRTADMFVPILFIMAIAVTIQSATAWLQRRLTPWQPLV